MTIITADSWFDGDRLHAAPVTVRIADGVITALEARSDPCAEYRVGFLMPGLVEAHCHLFLDGAETDPAKRSAYLKAPRDAFVATGRRNLDLLRAAGVTLVRDAGDRWGVNDQLRAEAAGRRARGEAVPRVRSPGRAIRKRGRYGSFMAEEVDDADGCTRAVAMRALTCDDLKILLTGIIDPVAGQVKGAPQFDAVELGALTAAARAAGLPTFAHCSGGAGLDLALACGVDSIEHGFFMTPAHLRTLAVRGTAWVPTWSPVARMRDLPAAFGLDGAAVDGIVRILAQHRDRLAEVAAAGACLVAGSDAGSCGVVHGAALHDELAAYAAAGVPLDRVLASCTSAPRRAWGVAGDRLAVGAPAELAGFAHSPVAGLEVLRRAQVLVQGDVSVTLTEAQCPADMASG